MYYHYSDYWRSWSRVLSDSHPKGPFVEVDLTPINDWDKVRAVNIRFHCTPHSKSDVQTDVLPDEVRDNMIINLGADLAEYLLTYDFLNEIDYSAYKRHCNGGCPFDMCKSER